MTDVLGCVCLAVGLSQYISLLSHLDSGSEPLEGYFNHITPSLFTSNFRKCFIFLLANNPSPLPSFISYSTIYSFTSSHLFSSSSLTFIPPSCMSPQPIYISLFAPHLSLCFHSVTAHVTKFRALLDAHSLFLSLSLHCASTAVLPFHSQSDSSGRY